MRLATSRSPSSKTSRQGLVRRRLHLAHAPAQVVRAERHHLGAEAVEEGGVARLVDELGGQEQLDLAAGRGQQERRQVRGHALLADVERAEAPDHALLRRRWACVSQCSRSTEKSSSCAFQFWRSQSA